MDLLEQLEAKVDELLARQEALSLSNGRLLAEIDALNREKTDLADKNNNLHALLEQERNLRAEALRRVENLLLKIQEHDSVG